MRYDEATETKKPPRCYQHRSGKPKQKPVTI
nr:MAG TPA: hypothetical protein [Caudoviricetes sp.]